MKPSAAAIRAERQRIQRRVDERSSPSPRGGSVSPARVEIDEAEEATEEEEQVQEGLPEETESVGVTHYASSLQSFMLLLPVHGLQYKVYKPLGNPRAVCIVFRSSVFPLWRSPEDKAIVEASTGRCIQDPRERQNLSRKLGRSSSADSKLTESGTDRHPRRRHYR